MRHTRLSLVLIALALVVAACTSDSDDTTTTAASTTEPTTTETTTTEPPTTTEAATTTTAEPEEPHPLPELNPPSVGTDGINPYIPIEPLPRSSHDRCAWTRSGDALLWNECMTTASSQVNRESITEEFEGNDTVWQIREDWEHTCFPHRYEFVSPTDEDSVNHYLLEAGLPGADELAKKSEGLPGGLMVYETEDPLRAVAALIAAGVPASPRYALVPSPIWAFGPGGPALPADPAVVANHGIRPRTGNATITVVDTGPVEAEPIDLGASIRGHSHFIAGIITRVLPYANVVERSALIPNGDASPVPDDHTIVEEIRSAVAPSGELDQGGVINLSLGTYTCTGDHLPLELAAYLGEMVATDLNIAVVAAAGNDSHEAAAEGDLLGSGDPPFWPAGFSDPDLIDAAVGDWNTLSPYPQLEAAISALHHRTNVIGVGALVRDVNEDEWLPAEFSNQVAATVWAPGVNIISDHPKWSHLAQWDGTSFAAPYVSALIASCTDPGVEGGYLHALAEVSRTGSCSP